MAAYYQTEGVNTYFVADVDITAMNSYETDMLYNNFIDGIIQPEFRALNSEMMIYNRINGMRTLADVMEESSVSELFAARLFAAVCDTFDEVGEYMLSPDNLLVEFDRIFCGQDMESFRLIYVPGNGRDIRGQIKRLIEDMLRKINHRDHGITDFMYGLYDMSLGENFDMDRLRAFVKKRVEELTENEPPQTSRALRDMPDKEALLDTVFGESDSGEKKETPVKADFRQNVPGWMVVAFVITVAAGVCIGVCQYVSFKAITDVRPFMLILACLALEAYAYLEIKKRSEASLAAEGQTISCTAESDFETPQADRETNGNEAETHSDGRQTRTENRDICVVTDRTPAEIRTEDMTTVLTSEAETCGETQLLNSTYADGGIYSPPRYRIYFLSDTDDERKSLDVTNAEMVIGRDGRTADMVIDDSAVSRKHALMCGDGDGVSIRDNGSVNGTYVNGVRLAPGDRHRVQDEDKIMFGRRRYTVLVNRM